WENGNLTYKIDYLISLGYILKKYKLRQTSKTFTEVDSKYNRQISAIGKEGQKKLQETKVGIVGVGGTGSMIAEQLVRLGVRDIIITDFDKFEESNLTRMYGSYYENLFLFNSPVLPRSSKYKVSIIEKNLRRINPKLKLNCQSKNIVLTDTVKDILDRDVIFSCTDEHWGRSIINQICYQYLIPTINTGVRIATENDQFKTGTIVSHLLIPDKPCLWCSEYLSASRIYAESTCKEEREKLVNEGYIENINDKAPSVITFTSLGSSLSMMIFLNLITGYLGDYGEFSTLRFDMKMVDLRRGKASVKEDCICRKVLGKGDFANLFTIKELPES
ncbi:MAG: ThiF family adenylyltransferase, partial [Eubacteriales bacterium]